MAACVSDPISLQRDLDVFPGATDVVRVGTDRWKQYHDDILETIFERVGCFLQARADMPFEALQREFHQNGIRIRDGDQYVRGLFGPEPMFLSPDDEIKVDVKSLVYRPQSRVHKGKLIAEFGGGIRAT